MAGMGGFTTVGLEPFDREKLSSVTLRNGGWNMKPHGLEKFGIRSADGIALCESSAALETDIRAAPGLSELLQDDSLAFHAGYHIWSGVIRKLDTPLFLDLLESEIGQMLSNLRGKGESYMCLPRFRAREIGPDDITPEEFLKAAGWEVLNNEDQLIFDGAWKEAGGRWID
ncbi:hypothetical protein N6H05_12435 [Sphingobium sp. WTD-1]|uniref:hypothetical protein n=1 Tax=Sphingobium sp. WTD-1 TaxID=2979467 RepID=UPI0024DED772|nr:hypothetical protein [Sphingobium sp. WTD-1]WIA58554.1 hypothetical protein N6H05_12435 [Sphingobium sp. WTD-1]